MDLFDILGINTREDSLTDLISSLFNEYDEFKRSVIDFLGSEFSNYKDCKMHVRNTFSIDTGKKRRTKILPDMIISSKSEDRLIVIESKICAGEGIDQTMDYSSDDAEKQYEKTFDVKAKNISYYFISMRKQTAVSTKFKSVSWIEFFRKCVCPLPTKITMPNMYKITVDTILERLNEIDKALSEVSNKSLEDVMDNCFHWVFPEMMFEEFFKPIAEKVEKERGYKYEICPIMGRNGMQDIVKIYNPNWIDAGRTNVHIELNWNRKNKKLNMYIHCESDPYMPENDLKANSVKYDEVNKLKSELRKVSKDIYRGHKIIEYSNRKWSVAKMDGGFADSISNMKQREISDSIIEWIDAFSQCINKVII